MCDFTDLSSAISPVARVFRSHITRRDAVGPFEDIASMQGLWWLGHHHAARWPAFREQLERTSSESELMTHTEHFMYLIHLESFTLNCIYIYILCVWERERVCVYRAASRATVLCKYGKHTDHLQKRLLCSLTSKGSQYSHLLSSRACLYMYLICICT